jgi:hypothetical protein
MSPEDAPADPADNMVAASADAVTIEPSAVLLRRDVPYDSAGTGPLIEVISDLPRFTNVARK